MIFRYAGLPSDTPVPCKHKITYKRESNGEYIFKKYSELSDQELIDLELRTKSGSFKAGECKDRE